MRILLGTDPQDLGRCRERIHRSIQPRHAFDVLYTAMPWPVGRREDSQPF